MEILVKSEKELDSAAAEILRALGSRRHLALSGPIGAGKTTLTSAICRVLGVADDVSSPTFSIINEYHNAAGDIAVYHFDFYRIEDLREALDLGLDDYFDSSALCLMEWAGNVESLLPEDTAVLRISVQEDGARLLQLED